MSLFLLNNKYSNKVSDCTDVYHSVASPSYVLFYFKNDQHNYKYLIQYLSLSASFITILLRLQTSLLYI